MAPVDFPIACVRRRARIRLDVCWIGKLRRSLAASPLRGFPYLVATRAWPAAFDAAASASYSSSRPPSSG